MSEGLTRLQNLPKAYPRLFPDGVLPSEVTVDGGWAELVELLCVRIDAILQETPGARMNVSQIEQRLGGLFFYGSFEKTTPEQEQTIHEAIWLANEASFSICKKCSDPVETQDGERWIHALCPKCRPVQPKPKQACNMYKNSNAAKKPEFSYPRLLRGDSPWVCDYDWGWRDLVKTLCARINTILEETPDNTIQVSQVKSKFGGLRFYYDPQNVDPEHAKAIQQVVDQAEAASEHLCERCGSPEATQNESGWIMTLCPPCRAKLEKR